MKSSQASSCFDTPSSVNSKQNQRLTVSNCLQQQNESSTPASAVSQQKPTTTSTSNTNNFSKIESLLSTSSQNKSILKKKSSFINRKTIRNYTAAAQAAAVAQAQQASQAQSLKTNPLLLLQPSGVAAPASADIPIEFNKNFASIHNSYLSHLNSLTAASDALMQHQQHAIPHFHHHQSSFDENANLRLLVEVAVGLWEEQQRNYEYRN